MGGWGGFIGDLTIWVPLNKTNRWHGLLWLFQIMVRDTILTRTVESLSILCMFAWLARCYCKLIVEVDDAHTALHCIAVPLAGWDAFHHLGDSAITSSPPRIPGNLWPSAHHRNALRLTGGKSSLKTVQQY